MIRFCLFISFCFLLAIPATAQWTTVFSNSSYNLVDIQFTSAQIGYVAGDDGANGFILKTTDGGQNWTSYNLPIGFINKMFFLNDSVGYLVKGGVPVRMGKTTDGAQTWTGQALPDSCFVTPGLVALTDSSGFYMNNAGRFRSFSGSGNSVVRLADTLAEGGPILFPTATHGYLPQFTNVYRTTDGGQNWTVLPTNLTDWIVTCAFTDSITGYTITQDYPNRISLVAKTIDGAQSWQPLLTLNNFLAVEIAAYAQNVLVVGDTGEVKWTSNGGLTWATESTGVPWMGIETYRSVITSGNDAFIINGFAGQILKRVQPLSTVQAEPASFEVNLFPNPAENFVEIHSAQNGIFTVSILNLTGELVLSAKTEKRISTASLASGIYLVQIEQNGFVTNQKLVIR